MFLTKRFYITVLIVVLCFIVGYKSMLIFSLAQGLLLLLIVLCFYEFLLLFLAKKKAITAQREVPERFSNGDKNSVKIHLSNKYSFPISLEIIDEVPVQFQVRDLLFRFKMKRKEDNVLTYHIRPTERGVYQFGVINIFVSSKIGFINRRFKCGKPDKVKVYPSFIHLKEYELIASSNKLTEAGNKRVKKVGQQLEPEQIKDYIKGDDYRFINWKATARRNKLMTNVFRDERAQNIYCLIDCGRTMQSAFDEMTLLDYSINASLALSYVSMIKGDKAGLVTFEKKVYSSIPASRNPGQLQIIQEALHNKMPAFAESDFESLYKEVNLKIKQRSLLVLFTNFDSTQAMQRQLRYLSMLAKRHTVLVIFFKNIDTEKIATREPIDKSEVYETVVAEKIEYEKNLIINKLRQHNILSLLVHPKDVSIKSINKYLEIKSREM